MDAFRKTEHQIVRAKPVSGYTAGGRALREARESAGLKLADIGRALGTSEQLAGEIERGRAPLTHERIAKLPAAVRIAYLERLLSAAKAEAREAVSDLVIVARVVENRAAVALTAALADGRLDAGEEPGIRAAVLADRADLDAVDARMDEVTRERVSGIRIGGGQ